jgi:hypothetical protein
MTRHWLTSDPLDRELDAGRTQILGILWGFIIVGSEDGSPPWRGKLHESWFEVEL